jgi:hemoglobin-like flavoprotein
MPHSQVSPTGAILQLAAMQIEVALQTAESQVTALSDAIAAIAQACGELPEAAAASATVLRRYASSAVVAMQYHDQLMQRLSHVRDALTDLRQALTTPASAEEWHRILQAVRGRFSMEDERLLFDEILAKPTDQTGSHRALASDSVRGAVELF